MPETSKTRPPEGYETWLEAVMSDTELRSHWLFGDPEKGGYHERQDAVKFARAELAALRARIAKLEAKPEPPTPEVGKVYWARRLYKGMPCGPFRLQVLALTPKIIEYRENNWSGIRSAIMRDDLEIVEETTWE